MRLCLVALLATSATADRTSGVKLTSRSSPGERPVVVEATVSDDPDWVKLLELTLANYVLSRAVDPPEDFKCATDGSDHDSCKCWSDHGNPLDGQVCHEPKECLMYKDPDLTGYFNFTKLPNSTSALHDQLGKWSVPSDMYKAFDAAGLVQSADFDSFHLDIKDGKGHYDAHVGTLRNYQGSFYVGYVAGSADGDMVQPYSRHEKAQADGVVDAPAVVFCKFFDMKKRGYTDEEVAKINDGLQSYAYKKAANMVPQMRALKA